MIEGREEILTELMREDPRLLRVERVPVAGLAGTDRSHRIILTFDAGRLTIERVAGEAALRVAFGADEEDEDDTVRSDEDDPWWAVMGQPMVHAWAISSETTGIAELLVQFRPDGENPKLVSFRALESGLRVSAQPKAQAGH